MAMFRDRNDPVRLFARRVGMLVLVAVIFTAGSAVWSVYGKERESQALRFRAEQELNNLQQQEARLSENIAQLKTARGKEEALRENYEVGRAGEGLIIIVEPPTPEPIPQETGFRQWVNKFLPFW